MSYTTTNFKTKKALKEAVVMYLLSEDKKKRDNTYSDDTIIPIRCYNPGLGGDLSNFTGKVYLEGPHYPAAHSWYAEAELVDGKVVKVK